MHMADALLSPTVGCSMLAVSAGTIAYCSKKVREGMDDKQVPLMGVLGAFIFAAQMINFSIPATGSSGHLGGGLLLAILLGPYAAFLTIASVLTIQALFFADGGLLALGCNIFNLGLFPTFVAYPLIYTKIIGSTPTKGRIAAASLFGGVLGLQFGALGVVLETVASGISALPFTAFIMLMQPIHLGIGIVEGLVTAAVISFVYQARPELFKIAQEFKTSGNFSVKTVTVTFLAAAIVTGGFVSRFASDNPDGLEWSIKKVTGQEELKNSTIGLHGTLASIQRTTAILPDYSFKKSELKETNRGIPVSSEPPASAPVATHRGEPQKTGSHLGTSLSGILGGILTLAITVIIGCTLRKQNQTS